METKSKIRTFAQGFKLLLLVSGVAMACEAGPMGEAGEAECTGGGPASGGKGGGGGSSATGGITAEGGESGASPGSSNAGAGGHGDGGGVGGAEDGGAAGVGGSVGPIAGSGGGGRSGGAGGTAGASGSAGKTGTGGTGGKGGAAGTGGAGGKGGAAATGGSGGASGGSGPTAVCGNGTRETGEECDDGNRKDGDGCSALCRSKCEVCQQSVPICKIVYDDCFLGRTPGEAATTGPAGGQLRADLCRKVVECVQESRCVYPTATSNPQLDACYCGASSLQECSSGGNGKGNPQGPCVTQIQNAAETREYGVLQERFQSQDYAIGRAVGVRLTDCELSACYPECVEDRDKTSCEVCVVGAPETPGEYRCNESVKCLSTPLCNSVLACARRTGCALSGSQSCYSGGQGPCAAEIKAYSKLTTPTEIASFIVGSGLDAAMVCEVANCKSPCFGSGGTGGAGGAPNGSAGTSGGGAANGGSGGAPSGGGGGAAKGGSGGVSTGGTASTGGAVSTGGTLSTGGTTGGTLSTGGTSGVGGNCGNGTVESTEVCDAPFKSNNCGSDCGPITPAACLACEMQDPEGICPLVVDAADFGSEVAMEGPAAGTLRSTLYNETMDCVRDTGCAVAQLVDCYCGNVLSNVCDSGGGIGLCRAVLERSLEATAPGLITSRFQTTTFAGGRAMFRINSCQSSEACAPVCAPTH